MTSYVNEYLYVVENTIIQCMPATFDVWLLITSTGSGFSQHSQLLSHLLQVHLELILMDGKQVPVPTLWTAVVKGTHTMLVVDKVCTPICLTF